MSLSVPPPPRPLMLLRPGACREAIYEPKIHYRGSPFVLHSQHSSRYQHSFFATADVWTSVSFRVVETNQGRKVKSDYYAIRRFQVDSNGDSCHPIQELMGRLYDWKVSKEKVKHLSMPVECFFDVNDKSFYTVSEYHSMTLGKMLSGLRTWECVLCHNEIWSIVHQVLAGLEFLVHQGLQHDTLDISNTIITEDGVVKIGAIHHIRNGTSEGWKQMTRALKTFAKELLESSWKPCHRCEDEDSCEGDAKHAHFKCFCELLDITELQTGSLVDFGTNLRNVIVQAMRLEFIDGAKDSRPFEIVRWASGKVFHDIMPLLPLEGSDESRSRAPLGIKSNRYHLRKRPLRSIGTIGPRTFITRRGRAPMRLLQSRRVMPDFASTS